MGEEYGDPAPFQYFIDHGDPELVEAVRKGRRQEFAAFGWVENAPDPAGQETLDRCVLNHELRSSPKHAALHAFYKRLLEVRRSLCATQLDDTIAFEAERVMFVRRDRRAWLAFCLGPRAAEITLPVPLGRWSKLLSSADKAWNGPGDALPASIESAGNVRMLLQPYSFVAYADTALPEAERP
jgi:maltooligosyltrehalose trehalohydrolase